MPQPPDNPPIQPSDEQVTPILRPASSVSRFSSPSGGAAGWIPFVFGGLLQIGALGGSFYFMRMTLSAAIETQNKVAIGASFFLGLVIVGVALPTKFDDFTSLIRRVLPGGGDKEK